MSSNQALIDALTLRQIFIERYSKGEAARLVKHLTELSARLQAVVGSEYDTMRAVALATQAQQITQALLDEYGEDLYQGLRDFAEQEIAFAQQAIVSATAAEAVSPGSLRQIQAAITAKPMKLINGNKVTELTIDQAAKQFSTNKARQVAQIVRDGATVGRTSQEVTRELADLVDNRTRQQAAALVRTATNHIGNEARSQTYAANDDVITGEEFVATLDAHTTITCGSLDGQVFDIGQGPIPPLHWSCRSVRTPVINPEYNLGSEITGERASADGPVSANRTFGGWLKDQSEEVQNEVLGVERAKLFRSGKLSIGKFTDDTGKVYTLEELKRLNDLK